MWVEETQNQFSTWLGCREELVTHSLGSSSSIIAPVDRSWANVHNEVRKRIAQTGEPECHLCNRRAHSLVGSIALSMRVPSGDSVKSAEGRLTKVDHGYR